MHNFIMGLVGAAAIAITTPANAVVTIDFGSAPGNLGPDRDYTAGGFTVTASGYADNDVDGDLYGTNFGGDEQGLGLAADPTGQNEIYVASAGSGAFIQLDVSSILNSVSMAQFFMGSTTLGEGWLVYGSNTDACGIGCGVLLLSGNDELVLRPLSDWGTYSFYDFYATGTSNNPHGNVLLGGLELTPSVPEPGTWGMMLLGFAGLGLVMRRSRKKIALAQLA